MHLSLAEFDALDAARLAAFIELCLPEGSYLDYKRTLDATLTDKEKREFAKDVSAFANADGGLLVYGYDEPDVASQTPGAFTGVRDGQKVAETLERVASSRCDPPLPGLRFRAIAVESDRSAIVCFIPPSPMRPHAVDGRFHLRGSESSQPMRAAEVRHSVLRSYSRRSELDAAFTSKADELARYWLGDAPGFVLQAIPVLEVGASWEVHTPPFEAALRGHDRNRGNYNLMSFVAPYRGVQRLQGDQARDDTSTWHTEVHASGHVCAVAPNRYSGKEQQHYLTGEEVDLFYAFGRLVDSCLDAAGQSGCQMTLRAEYRGASSTVLYLQGHRRPYGPPRTDTIVFPELLADADADATSVSAHYADMLFHAFGLAVPEGERRGFPWPSTVSDE